MLAGELLQILVEPDGPVAAGGYLFSLQVQELVGRHVLGQLVTALGHEHSREYEAVKHYVVLAYEVDNAAVGRLPVPLPRVGKQLFGVAYITYGCVEPHIQHLAFHAIDGYRDAPVQVAGHGTRLQVLVEPRLALSIHVGLPLLVPFQYPFAQARLPLVEWHIPVLGFLQHGGVAGDGTLGVYQVGGVEARATRLALVAIGMVESAVGAGAGHITVGQELVGLFVIELLTGLLHKLAFLIERAEKFARRLPVHRARGAGIHIERDSQPLHRLLDYLVVAIHYILWRHSLFLRLDGDGHAMLVAAAHHYHILAFEAQVTGIDVGRHIHPGQVTYVDRAVGIGQRRGH